MPNTETRKTGRPSGSRKRGQRKKTHLSRKKKHASKPKPMKGAVLVSAAYARKNGGASRCDSAPSPLPVTYSNNSHLTHQYGGIVHDHHLPLFPELHGPSTSSMELPALEDQTHTASSGDTGMFGYMSDTTQSDDSLSSPVETGIDQWGSDPQTDHLSPSLLRQGTTSAVRIFNGNCGSEVETSLATTTAQPIERGNGREVTLQSPGKCIASDNCSVVRHKTTPRSLGTLTSGCTEEEKSPMSVLSGGVEDLSVDDGVMWCPLPNYEEDLLPVLTAEDVDGYFEEFTMQCEQY